MRYSGMPAPSLEWRTRRTAFTYATNGDRRIRHGCPANQAPILALHDANGTSGLHYPSLAGELRGPRQVIVYQPRALCCAADRASAAQWPGVAQGSEFPSAPTADTWIDAARIAGTLSSAGRRGRSRRCRMGVSKSVRPDAAIRAVSIHSAALTPSVVARTPASSAPTGIIANPAAQVAEMTRPS